MATSIASVAAPVLEIFPSLQGEGAFVGLPQVFVRYGRCNLVCNYCDTPESIGAPPVEAVVTEALGRAPRRLANPLDVATIVGHLEAIRRAHPAYASVAITGGEPLLHVDHLEQLLPVLVERGWRVLLETNALLAHAMTRIARWVEIASLDVKLPAETGVPWATLAAKHGAFLVACADVPVVYVKIVVTAATTPGDLERAFALLAAAARPPELFLTPVSPMPDGPEPPALEALLAAAASARGVGLSARILPQLHRLAGWR